MRGVGVEDVRNFVILGHPSSGKTTLTEGLLHTLGVVKKQGSVDQGTSHSDWTDEEKERQTSIYSATFTGAHVADGHNMEVLFTDTPGYADFFGQVIAATRASDAALITIDARSGIQVGSSRAWRLCEERNKARGIVITGLDKENADFETALAAIQSTWGGKCVPVVLPTPDLSSVIDIMGASEFPAELEDEARGMKGSLVELAAETDDQLIEKFLSGEALSAREIAAGMHSAVANGSLVPIFVAMPLTGVGMSETLDGVCRLFPSPIDVHVKDADGKEIDFSPEAPLTALVMRSVYDAFTGQMSYVRIYGGTLKDNSEIFNVSRGIKERVHGMLALNGHESAPVTQATAGDIVALPKLKNTHASDVLCDLGKTAHLDPIAFPSPVMSYAVRAKSRSDEDKIGEALHRLTEEDPTIKIDRNAETHELVVSGLGDVHLDTALHHMKLRSNVDVETSIPKVAYRETVQGEANGHYRHKKQSGGRGQFGEVYLKVGPRDPNENEWFINKIVGGAIPGNFIPAVEKGLVEGLEHGSIGAYPIMNVKITLYDGSYHDVDSSEIAFKIAAARAMREACSQARPVLMEPVMKVHVTAPDAFMGDINGDLSHRRGRIMGVDSDHGLQVIEAEVPQSELFRYAAELRSLTGGQGSFWMEFDRYDIVPSNLTQKIAAASDRKVADDD